ncbi:hypothetical protein GLYMA_08G265967v4 [Glycine max]|uniref:plastidal glycolate/glycerate translocator 1, chloroplastic isoform X2 n=1 Tax=Glycine max TaxID=3847 RepID=UPI001B356F42|nr:plastidal glycolate/glycerate translocator 1, chloroplastic-like isoform X2 [Glycine max]KAG4399602.1 hypothetical protein GLYMA_08G265967v4 [Glycine max]KAG4399604.1 hypothetical protein GLYMA_08G265967v4 [Glycine max]KAH1053238.1 hypothetical protein GYH30_022492 [Glycine max]KAH1053240.1 hypothetical protein GYH30_022492 [Glycine max]
MDCCSPYIICICIILPYSTGYKCQNMPSIFACSFSVRLHGWLWVATKCEEGQGLNLCLVWLQGYYLTKASSNPGAGDILMGFLESVILSFSFSMFKQRKLVKRHAAEIFTSVIISTLFSLYSTAFVGRLVQLEPSLTVSILPRCITVALALSIVSLFDGANSSLTAAVVVLTGLVGANFVQATLDKLSFRDPIARGIATASSAHRLGTAALSAKEPEALPFCAIAYALNALSLLVECLQGSQFTQEFIRWKIADSKGSKLHLDGFNDDIGQQKKETWAMRETCEWIVDCFHELVPDMALEIPFEWMHFRRRMTVAGCRE